MSIVERIKEFIDFKGIAVTAFERSVGMSNASFGKSLRNKGAIGSDKIEKILEVYPEINTEWLLTGEGDKIKKCRSKMSQQNVAAKEENVAPIVAPIVVPIEKDDYDPSNPKWNADFSALGDNKKEGVATGYTPSECPECVEKVRTINYLCGAIATKEEVIKAKEAIIQAQNATIDSKEVIIASKNDTINALKETIRCKDELLDELFEKRANEYEADASTSVSSAS